MAEAKDSNLQFPDIAALKSSDSVPKFSTVASNTSEDTCSVEDVDSLQLELETLLVAVSQRIVQLDVQIQQLNDWQDKKDSKKVSGKQQQVKEEPQTPAKRGRPPADDKSEKVSKKVKESTGGKPVNPGTPTGPGRPKTKSVQKITEYEFTEEAQAEPIAPRVPRNDAPDRFWAAVEPYCADITSDDVKALDELIKTADDDSEIYKVPPLGKHYSLRWAQEDLIDEQKEGSKVDKKKGGSESNEKDANDLLKRVGNSREDDLCPFGPLTQRLISALVEENIMTPIEDIIMDNGGKGDNGDTNHTQSPGSNGRASGHNGKPFIVPHTRALEARIREELIQQGLLDADEPYPEDLEADEILMELEKRQAELKALSAHNRAQKLKLMRLAKEEMAKQEIRAKIKSADNEVMEAFRRIMAAKQKKRPPTKKERDQAQKSLKERETLLKQLESI